MMVLIRKYYYKVFGKLIFNIEAYKRTKINKKRSQYKLVTSFRKLEAALREEKIKYPDNEFNKMMSMVLTDIELFGHLAYQFNTHRQALGSLTRNGEFLRSLNPGYKTFPSHPSERYIKNAIKIDSQSLFIFGTILMDRSLLLLKMYLPDREGKMYSKIGKFYFALCYSKS